MAEAMTADERMASDLAKHAGARSHDALKDALTLLYDSVGDRAAASTQLAMSFAGQAVAAAAGVILANTQRELPNEEEIAKAQVAVMTVLLEWIGPYRVVQSTGSPEAE